ncbi:MAG: LysR family transcriptional regulator [Actinomycetota bacterium]
MHESLDRSHVELLIELTATEHLGRAAGRLAISASAASHRLAEAERRLGIELTTSVGRGLRPTPACRHLAEVGDAAHRSLRAAEDTARWMASTEQRAVRLAIDFFDTAPWFERLPDAAELPVPVDFVRVGYGEVVDAAALRRVDLGIVPEPCRPDTDEPTVVAGDLDADTLTSDLLMAVVRADHAAASRGLLLPGDVADDTYYTAGERPSPGFEHHEFFEPAGIRPGRLQKVESTAMILRLLRRHGGVTIQPALAVRDAPLRDLAVIPLAGVELAVRWRLHRSATAPPATDELVDTISGLVSHGAPDLVRAR